MIHKIEIINAKDSPFPYIDSSRNPDFNLGISYGFTKGVNIIVGANSSGKSTLLNIIREYTLCGKDSRSMFPNILYSSKLFSSKDSFRYGVNVHANYTSPTFDLLLKDDSTTLSKGDVNLHRVEEFFNLTSSPDRAKHFSSPANIVDEELKYVPFNSPWHDSLNSLIKYYKTNNVTDDIISIIMDNPDRDLDLYNTSKLYDILSNKRDNIQVILSLDNPYLIFKLSLLPRVNFIELTGGYLNEIIDFVHRERLDYEFLSKGFTSRGVVSLNDVDSPTNQ